MMFFRQGGGNNGDALGPPPPPFRLDRERLSGGVSGAARWLLIIAVIVALYILLSIGKSIYTEYLWFDSLKFSTVYTTVIRTRVILFFVGAIIFAGLLALNIALARRLVPKVGQMLLTEEEFSLIQRVVNIGIIILGIFITIIFASVASGKWDLMLRYMNAQSFGTTDPIFHRDVGFYVFNLPVYVFVQRWLLAAAFVLLIGSAGIYAFHYSVRRFSASASGPVRAHLSGLGAFLLLVFGWGYWLDTYRLNFSERGNVFGASYTDVHAQLWGLRLLMAVTLAGALLLLWNIRRRSLVLPGVIVGAWIVFAIGAGVIYPALVQRLTVEPNELTKERQYIQYNIEATRRAFALDRIEENQYRAADVLTPEQVAKNPLTIGNVRLWDHRPLKDTYNQIQSIRLQYDFHDVDIDRYTTDGQYTQVALSARELPLDKIPAKAKTWVNERLVFTHGYGAVMSPVNAVGPEGLPVLFLKDLPTTGKLDIKRNEIYYGERTDSYVIVNSNQEEFDYPLGDQNKYTRYEATSGVKLGSMIRRIAYAWQFADPNIVLSSQITDQSRILYFRKIQDRVRHIAPFLMLDYDPYLVVADGRLFWIQDAYTTTSAYPYSEPYGVGATRINYMRNSVKVVIDAYTGDAVFYIADPTDPIVQAYQSIFPKLFTPGQQMPDELKAHVRYPEDFFRVQADMYRTYHMTDPQVLYNKEDLWVFPVETVYGMQEQMQPYYLIMRLPDQAEEEFVLLIPFTPVNKDNAIGWMAARADGWLSKEPGEQKYGKLISFKFPKDKLVYGPKQIESRISQDPQISAQFALWDQGGTRVIRGNLLMIPIEDSFLFVEPIYLQAATGRIPELKRIVVANGDRLAMEETLAKSLAVVFKLAAPSPPVTASPVPSGATPTAPATSPSQETNVAALVQSAQDHFNRAQDALKAGDWAGYGQELAALKDVLARLGQLTSR
ncbi:MAG: UPF0182 family protein [Chloroflexi bacterium]|nr:UPF0182 family protein [Chloroflexota bacterium]